MMKNLKLGETLNTAATIHQQSDRQQKAPDFLNFAAARFLCATPARIVPDFPQ
jgi:hypothetical protein